MTILVTGGAGFIGSNFVNFWLDNYNELLINIDKLTYAGNLSSISCAQKNPKHIFVKGDIGDHKLVGEIFNQYSPRCVFNFAAESHVDRSIVDPSEFIQTNILGTYNLLSCVKDFWENSATKMQKDFRFLHVSTDEVFGALELGDPAFTEKNQFCPNSPYSASKAASDHLVRAWHHTYGLPVLTSNCSNNYGPYHHHEKLIPRMITRALKGKTLPIFGNGQQVRDWLHVEDHCRALCSIQENGVLGETYNVGGGTEMKNIEIVRLLCKLLDEIKPRKDCKSYEEQIKFVDDRIGHDFRYAIDTTKISKDLGWKPLETFETGIRKTVLWYLAQDELLAKK